jgi:hypothetical protein
MKLLEKAFGKFFYSGAMVIAGVTELARMLLMGYFQAMALSGKTEEEMLIMFHETKKVFDTMSAEKLPDV